MSELRDRMTAYAEAAANRALRPAGRALAATGGRHATIFPDDRLIVSYPRSGNTWLTFLLTNLMHPEEPTRFSNLEARCPDIHGHSDAFLLAMPRPRLLKSHEAFDGRYPRVVYLVRDPRDVVVSYWRFLQKMKSREGALDLDAFVEWFVDGGTDERGTWAEHLGSWRGARGGSDGLLLVRYEDLRADPAANLERIAAFVGLTVTDDDCRLAVERSTPDEMRRIEREEEATDPYLRNTRRDIPFVGPAKVGRWEGELSDAAAALIVERWSEPMAELGYR